MKVYNVNLLLEKLVTEKDLIDISKRVSMALKTFEEKIFCSWQVSFYRDACIGAVCAMMRANILCIT